MKYIISLLILLSLTSVAIAQDLPKVEVFTGYSFVRDEVTFHGFEVSVNYNINEFLGIKADFSRHSKNNITFFSSPDLGTSKGDLSAFSYLIGPQLTYRKHQLFTPYTHLLLGGTRLKTKVTITAPPSPPPFPSPFPPVQTIEGSDNAFTVALGGGLDINLTKTITFRAIQIDALITRSGGQTDRDPRISTGLVFKFGYK